MAVTLEYKNLIIPIEKIEKFYPGGFAQYKLDNTDLIGKRIWFDNYLVRDGALYSEDIETLIKKLESMGFNGIIETSGRKKWADLCVVDINTDPSLSCDWLLIEKNFASHVKDKSKIVTNRSNVSEIFIESFNSTEWLKKFRDASKSGIGFRELRVEIFQQTVRMVKKGGYELNEKEIILPGDKVTEQTAFFEKPGPLKPIINSQKTKFSVVEADCIETAELLKKSGYDVCVLNMANRQNPGGGVAFGSGAQEENIFRRTNLLLSLYQFVDYSNEFGIKRQNKSYPLNKETGGIYSKDVTVFRGSENNGYCLLKNPFKLCFVSVPAISRPKLEYRDGEFFITKSFIEPSKEKIRTILRISAGFNHDCLVLSAFGCGAYGNPPQHMAKLFNDVFHEIEFTNRFKMIVFSIIDDHNTRKEHNPEGNVLPFYREFEANSA